MQTALEKVTAVWGKARQGDGKSILVVGAAVAAGAVLASWILAPGDGPARMNADQKALNDERKVAVSAGRSISVRRATKGDISGAARVLADSAASDPLMLACSSETADAASKQKAFSYIFSTLLKASVPTSYGAVPLVSQQDGEARPGAVALWYPRGGDVSISAIAFHGGWAYVPRFSGWARRGRFPGYSEVIRARRQRHMKGTNGNYYYLMTAGAAGALSASAAQEHLKAVLLPVVQRADEQKVPCYAETTGTESSPVRSALEAVGFELVEPFHLFGATVFIMKREPAK